MNLLAKTAIVFFVMLFGFCGICVATFLLLVWLDSHSTSTTGGAFVFLLLPPICGVIGAFLMSVLTNHFLHKR